MPRRGEPRPATAFFVAEDCHPQTIAVVQTRAAAARHRRPRGRRRRRSTSQARTSSACSCSTRRPTAASRDYAALADARPRGGRCSSWRADLLALDAAAPPGEFGRRHRASARPALRRAPGLRRAARRVPLHPRRVQAPACRAASSASPRTPRASPPTAWPCRRASSTSAATRPRATSAPRRCCSRSWPACTRSTTGPRACARSRGACTRSTASLAAGLRRLGLRRRRRRRSSTPCACALDAARRPRSSRARASAAHQPARATPTARSASPSTRRRCRRTCSALLEVFAGERPSRPIARARPRGRRPRCPARFARTSAFLTHPVFNRHHSEHEMLRYMRRLQAQRPLAHHLDDPARLVHHEAQRHRRDDARDLARVRRAPSLRARGPGAGLRRAVRASSRPGWPRSPASRPSRSSRTPARRANTRACSPSAPTTRAAARRTATSA